MVTLFDSYSYDGVSAGLWVIHTYIHVCVYKFDLTVAHLCPITAFGMVSFGGLLSEYVVTLLLFIVILILKRLL